MGSVRQLEVYLDRLSKYATENSKKVDRITSFQRKEERKIIESTNSFCPYQKIFDVIPTVDDVNRALEDGYGDMNILRTLMCFNNTLLVFPDNPQDLTRSLKVRRYLENLTQIGNDSVEGYAMKASVEYGKTFPYVVKSPRSFDEESVNNFVHEYFVGAFGTNTLRDRIPNFAFIMGLFGCSPPYIDNWGYVDPGTKRPNEKKALVFCGSDNESAQVSFVIYENVTNSVSLRQFIRSGCTFTEFLNVFVQIVLALQLANEEFDYTHYDLHDENVLVKTLPEEITINYSGLFLTTRHVATIIDQGRAHISYRGESFGYSMVAGGVFPERAFPMYDLFKLLMFSLETATFKPGSRKEYEDLSDQQLEDNGLLANPAVFREARKMISRFYPRLDVKRSSGEYIGSTRRFFYTLPYSSTNDISALEFFNTVIIIEYPDTLRSFMGAERPTERLYGCTNNATCLSLKQAIGDYTTSILDEFMDPFIFYETYFSSAEEDRPGLKEEAFGLFPTWMEELWRLASGTTDRINDQIIRTRALMENREQEVRFIANAALLFNDLKTMQEIGKVTSDLVTLFPDWAKIQSKRLGTNYFMFPERMEGDFYAALPFMDELYVVLKDRQEQAYDGARFGDKESTRLAIKYRDLFRAVDAY